MSNQRVPIDLPYSYLREKTKRILDVLEVMEQENPNVGLPAIKFGLNNIHIQAENIIRECNKLKQMAKDQHNKGAIHSLTNEQRRDYPYLGD